MIVLHLKLESEQLKDHVVDKWSSQVEEVREVSSAISLLCRGITLIYFFFNEELELRYINFIFVLFAFIFCQCFVTVSKFFLYFKLFNEFLLFDSFFPFPEDIIKYTVHMFLERRTGKT